MDKHTKALELDKILEMVAAEASSEDGAQLARELSPVHTAAEAKWLLEETDAAFVAMAKFGAPSFYGMKNVTNPLRRAQAGGGLGLRELLDIGAKASARLSRAGLRCSPPTSIWRRRSSPALSAKKKWPTALPRLWLPSGGRSGRPPSGCGTSWTS